MDAAEFERSELQYLMDDQKKSVQTLNDMERNVIAVSAAIYSFALANAAKNENSAFIVAMCFLPLLITIVARVRFRGIFERMHKVDERIAELQNVARVDGWWSNRFSNLMDGQAVWVKSRYIFWKCVFVGNFVFLAILLCALPASKRLIDTAIGYVCEGPST